MPKKRVEYRLAPAATRDLEGIWLYTLKEWGIDQVANNPQLGASCDYIRKGYRRSRVGRHAIYFRITDYGIAVIRVLHDRMDAPRRL
ncbi:MAG: type II toxin-antitoxin system RelE/ParE family toxin [Proteobacteria bacterium]|nr:type II toxin-antitoxin system RelE/ParE family toxin [Pseudomonadota bacterium]